MERVKTLLLIISLATASMATPSAVPRVLPTEQDQVIELSLLDLMSIDYRPGKKLPYWVRALDGRRVRIEGYMALGTPEGVEQFELVWDSCGCGQSNIHHFIDVSLTEETTTFDPNLIWVEGEFSVGEVREDGFVVSLFRLKTKSVGL
jgi:hypothetical protein